MTTEHEQAARRNKAIQKRFLYRRTYSIITAAVFGVVSLALTIVGMWVFAVCAIFISLIGISNYLAANGHLHRVQKRGNIHQTLIRDFSKLDPDAPSGVRPVDPTPPGTPAQT